MKGSDTFIGGAAIRVSAFLADRQAPLSRDPPDIETSVLTHCPAFEER
jgi:hypothetical protein